VDPAALVRHALDETGVLITDNESDAGQAAALQIGEERPPEHLVLTVAARCTGAVSPIRIFFMEERFRSCCGAFLAEMRKYIAVRTELPATLSCGNGM
jgi:hypothetical protein